MVSNTPRLHFTPGKDPIPILQEAGWVPGPVWTGGKSRPHRDSIPDRPARSQSLYRLSYPAHPNYILLHINVSTSSCACCSYRSGGRNLTIGIQFHSLHITDSQTMHVQVSAGHCLHSRTKHCPWSSYQCGHGLESHWFLECCLNVVYVSVTISNHKLFDCATPYQRCL